MKKLLLAASYMIIMTGAVFAQVPRSGMLVSGSANFGIKYDDAAATGAEKLKFHHEFDVKFTAFGTTDGGLRFGAVMTIDNNENTGGSRPGIVRTTFTRKVTAAAVSRVDGTTEDACYLINGKLYAQSELANITKTAPLGAAGEAYDLGGGLVTFVNNGAAAKAILAGSQGVIIKPLSTTTERSSLGTYLAGDGQGVVVHEVTAGIGKAFANCGADTDNAFVGGPLLATTTIRGSFPGKVANNAAVFISLNNHRLLIGQGIESADFVVGGIADVGFDGVGVDDVAEAIRGRTKRQLRYDGSFGVGSVAVTYRNQEWAAGFNFDVAPVKVGAGFDSHGVMSVGLGLSQGQIAGNLFYSSDSDANGVVAGKPGAKAMGMDMSYAVSDATKIIIAFGRHENEALRVNKDAFGVGFSHLLGGGATLAAGAASIDKVVKADLGVSLKF